MKPRKSTPFRPCISIATALAFASPLAFLALGTGSAWATTDTFTTSGTWTCPVSVTSISVAVQGGGGAGGAASTTQSSRGGGGGGGGCAFNSALTVEPGVTYTVTVGASRAGGSGAGAAGNPSSFSGGVITTLTANGGGGGGLNTGSGGSGGAGGTATGGTVNRTGGAGDATSTTTSGGGGGGGAGTGSNGSTSSNTTGGAGGTGSPAGGAGANQSGSVGAGSAGSAAGGGGSGAYRGTSGTQNGGAGARGQVTIVYSLPTGTTIVKDDNATSLDSGSSWVGLTAPGTFDTAQWDNTVTSANTTVLGADLIWGGISILNPAGLVTVNAGNTLTLGAATTDIDLSSATQDLTLNCGLALNAANVWDVTASQTLTLGGAVSGPFSVTKQGAGTATLSGTSTYTGNTTVTGGTLNITGPYTGDSLTSSMLLGSTGASAVVNVGNDMNLLLISGANATGSSTAYNQTAGTVNVSPITTANYVAKIGYGYFNLTGGTYKQNSNRFSVTDIGATAIGVAYVGGTGILDVKGASPSMIIGYSGTGSLTVGPGGSVDRNSGAASNFWLTTNAGSYGVLNVAGGNFDNTGSAIRVGNTNAGTQTGFLNLAKGTLTIGLNGVNGINAAGSSALYTSYAGGTLKASANLTAVVPATNANLASFSTVFGPITNNNNASSAFNTQIGTTSNFDGGLIVDSNNFGITYTSPLLGTTGNGVKQANITVTGGSGYTGAPMVQFTGGTGTPAAGYAVISGGAVTGIVITSPGDYSVDPTGVTLTGGGGTGASVALSALTANATDSGLTKINGGTLTLTNTNTYAGPTTINGGTLTLSGSGAVNNSSGITINGSDAKFLQDSGTASTPGITLTQGTLTGSGTVGAVSVADTATAIITNNNGVAGASLTTGALTFNGAATINTFSASTSAQIVTSSLSSNAAGTVTITPSAPIWTDGATYDLISYGGGSIGGAGFGQFTLGTVTGLSARQSASALGNSGTAITVTITGDTPYWSGNGDGKWNIASTNNWKLLSNNSAAVFLATDNALFNDNATGAGPINIDIDSANVAPTSTTFNNSTKDYVLDSTGGFGISTGSLVKNGTGKLTIKTVNTYPGSTTINGGTLVIDDGSIASSSNIVNNAVLEYRLNANARTYGNVISGSGTLTKSGTNTLTLSGANTFTGGLNIAGGVVTLSNASAAGDPTSIITFATGGATNATLQCDRASATTITNPVNVATGSTGANTLANVGSANVTFNSAITIGAGTTLTLANNNAGTSSLELGGSALVSGDGSVATSGTSTGNLIFRGANTYSGGTTLGGSSLHIPGASTNGPDGSPTDGNFGTGTVNIGNISIRSTTTADTTIGNTLTLAGDLTAVTSGSEKSLIFSGPATLTGTRTLTSNVGNTVAGKSLIFSGIIGDGGNAYGITKAGTGTLTLSGANTYTGVTTINAGTLSISADNNLGTAPGAATAGNVVIDGGTLAATSTFTLDSNRGIAVGPSSSSGSGSMDVAASQTLTYGGVVANNGGTGGLTKTGAGILALSGSNTYSGPTSISAGTLQISAAGNLGDGSATNTIDLGAGTLNSTAGSYDLGVNRTITLSGAGKVQADADTLTLSGDVANGANSLALLGAGNITVSGVIGTGATPTGALTVGSSTLPANVTLSGNNLFTGNVSLPGNNTQPKAVLTLTNSGALGVGPKTVTCQGSNATNGGQIRLQNNISFASDISFAVSGFTIYNDSGSNSINGNIAMASGAGATYLTSTSGTLTINGNMSASATLRSLSLRGAGNGVINGIIANGSTVDLPVLKDSGPGTWTLTGANTYTGGTTVSAGTLALGANNVLPDTAVTIGNGTLDAATFTDTVGTLNVTSTAKINLGAGAALVFAPGSPAWTGTLAITGTFVSGASLKFGSDNTGLTPAQLLLISAPGFTGFGLDASGFLTASVGGGYSSWQSAQNGGAGTTQTIDLDHDNDGVSNGVEYFLGGNTDTTGFTVLPGVTNTGGTLSVTWTKAASYTGTYGTDFWVETSATLTGVWATETSGVNVTFPTANEVKYTFPAGTTNFARLKVTGP